MILSMTGFGKAVKELSNKKISVEIKSLNSKQLDVNARISAAYKEKEMEIRTLLAQKIERGKVDVLVAVDHGNEAASSQLNVNAIEKYYKDILQLAKQLNVEPPKDMLSVLLKLPETIQTESATLDEKEWETVKATIEEALKVFQNFRKQEGKMLESIFTEKIKAIAHLLKEVDNYDTDRIDKIKTKMADGMKKLDAPYDQNRFEQEMIFYIERLDINEEKARLGNHLNYFFETMRNESSQGRKLGFITQEMGREINTLGSKSNHAEMQQIVVRMKDELEQIKEQILNVL
ncbi:MAG: YicC family protein [Candidatus Symbiothrix sp.]|nr:YicC family protein [Candidatus Symbiothrix sp.]